MSVLRLVILLTCYNNNAQVLSVSYACTDFVVKADILTGQVICQRVFIPHILFLQASVPLNSCLELYN